MPNKKNSTKRRTKPTVAKINQSPITIEVIPKENPLKIGVIIDPIKEPFEIQLHSETWRQEMKTLLGFENPLHRSCEYLNQSGYKISLFSGRNGVTKQLLYNSVATDIAKITVCGPVVIIRDGDEPFTLQDLNKVAEIADNFEVDRSMCKVQSRLRNITRELTEMKKSVWTREPTCSPIIAS